MSSCASLASIARVELDQLLLYQLVDESEQVGLRSCLIDVELSHDRLQHRLQRHRGLQQLPDPRADRVETVVHGLVEIEDCDLSAHPARHLTRGHAGDIRQSGCFFRVHRVAGPLLRNTYTAASRQYNPHRRRDGSILGAVKTLRFLVRQMGPIALVLAPLGLLAAGLSAGFLAAAHRAVTEHALDRALLLELVGYGFAKMLVSYLSTVVVGDHGARAAMRLRRDLIARVVSVPYRHLERVGTRRVHAALSHELELLESALDAVPGAVTSFAVLVGGALYLGRLSPRLFAMLLLVLVPCAVVARFAARHAARVHAQQREGYEELFSHFATLVDGAKELKLHAARRMSFLEGPVRDTTQRLLDQDVALRSGYARASAINQTLVLVVLASVFLLLPESSALRSEISSGYVLVGVYLMSPLAGFSRLWPQFRNAEVAMRNLEELGVRLAGAQQEASADPSARPEATRIELCAASFQYDDERAFKLGPLTFDVKRGEVLFVVGGNGSGKTTLGRLLVGLYAPSDGELRWDGTSVDAQNRDLYRQLWSGVFFDVHVFDRLYGIGAAVVQERAQPLLERLGLSSVVSVRDGAFSTIELSQGQLKRLSLFVALLEDRPFYLFDEWAAEQEPGWKQIFYRELLPELRAKGKGVVVITHDDRYFDTADRVLQLHDGALDSPS